MAEGGGLLNRYRGLNPYRGFESLLLRHQDTKSRLKGRLFVFAACPTDAGCYHSESNDCTHVYLLNRSRGATREPNQCDRSLMIRIYANTRRRRRSYNSRAQTCHTTNKNQSSGTM